MNYKTLSARIDPEALCKNYFNKAAAQLTEMAKNHGGDAVIQVRSVVFHMDGSSKTFNKAECFDDGAEGQILAKGIAIRWEKPNQIKPLLKKNHSLPAFPQ